MPSTKNTLDIRLTESVVFLRAGDGTGRNRSGTQPVAPPAMIRGLLTLQVVKPIKISSIEVELLGKTSTAWPEGVGARRVEISEDHKIHSQTCVFFKAGANAASTSHRRTLSVGPGLHLDYDYDGLDNSSDHSSELETHGRSEERRGREPTRGQQRGRAPRRLSADQTNYQPGIVSQRNEQLPTPPYSPMYSPDATPLRRSPVPSVTSPISYDDSPSGSMEEVRRALSEQGFSTEQRDRSVSVSREDTPPRSQHTSDESMPSLTRRISFDDPPPEFVVGSSSGVPPQGRAPPYSPSPSRSATTTSPHRHHGHDDRGRSKGKRLSIGMILDAVKERVRSVSRAERDTPPHSLSRDGRDESTERRDSSARRGRTREPRERSTLERVTEVLGLESEEDDDMGEGWKEFRKGVYTYPISFAIPANSPPTLTCEFGSVIWRLKALVHRPGAFTTKLTASKEVTVVASPSDDDTEETESIIVERQWEAQMQYLIAISGRSFPIGGYIPFSITFAPWTKMKIFRLSVVIEERIDYYTDFKRLVRTDPINRVVLLSLKDPHKDHPILPLSSDDIEAFRGSALYGAVSSEEDVSDVVSNLMGPGPWAIHKDLELPKSCSEIHFTNKNKKSNITISHTLKIIFRVQRGDDRDLDPGTGKRKMFDIVVQTPIHILSCLCGPDFTALPPYSEFSMRNAPVRTGASCRCGANAVANPAGEDVSTDASPALLSPDSAMSRGSSYFHRHGHHASATTSENGYSGPAPRAQSTSRPPATRLDSLLDRSSQFERLIAGHESELGEAPPAYDVATSPPLA